MISKEDFDYFCFQKLQEFFFICLFHILNIHLVILRISEPIVSSNHISKETHLCGLLYSIASLNFFFASNG